MNIFGDKGATTLSSTRSIRHRMKNWWISEQSDLEKCLQFVVELGCQEDTGMHESQQSGKKGPPTPVFLSTLRLIESVCRLSQCSRTRGWVRLRRRCVATASCNWTPLFECAPLISLQTDHAPWVALKGVSGVSLHFLHERHNYPAKPILSYLFLLPNPKKHPYRNRSIED